jgi:dTDP-4-dehydrorhamnose reductase
MTADIKIMITGAHGFVGARAVERYRNAVPVPAELTRNPGGGLADFVKRHRPDVILHTAAISDIGTCEADPEASFRANVLLPVYLAQAAEGAKLICFSSDQVYSGRSDAGPYTEDAVCPANTYARHKLEMERRVLDISPEAVMLRAEWMYGYYLKKPNFLMNLLNAEDAICFSSRQHRGVTYVKEVAEQMDAVLTLPGGVYNFGSETEKTIYEIAGGFLSLIGKDVRLLDGPPRHNLWMDCKKASALGIHFSRVEDGLKACARDLGLL